MLRPDRMQRVCWLGTVSTAKIISSELPWSTKPRNCTFDPLGANIEPSKKVQFVPLLSKASVLKMAPRASLHKHVKPACCHVAVGLLSGPGVATLLLLI